MVRLKDIAKETGLTVSTVSKALSHSKEISYETSKRVIETARSMGYVSKRIHDREEKTIGVILPEVQSQYYAKLMQTLHTEIENRGCAMITMLAGGYSAKVGPAIERMNQYGPDGLIICCNHISLEEEQEALYKNKIPVVVLTEKDAKDCPVDSICISTEQGMRLVVEHLLQLGHERIGYVGEYSSDVRYHAFCDALKQYGKELDPRFVKRTKERFEAGGYAAACELLQEEELPTAVFASYDQIAFGVMKAFLEHGVRIPKDVAIVGFDNVEMDDYYPIPLTSVTNPVEQMGISAVNCLLDAIQNPKTHVVQNVFMQSRLIVRKSISQMT